jgi:hypothetical protein
MRPELNSARHTAEQNTRRFYILTPSAQMFHETVTQEYLNGNFHESY